MPIIITGLSSNSPNDNKRRQKRDKTGQLLTQSSSDDLLQPASERAARGEDTSQGYLCSMEGITEIFNLRMYKVPRDPAAPATGPSGDGGKAQSTSSGGALSRPHVVKTKTILIGASYHLEEDSRTGKKKLRSKEAPGKPPKPAAGGEEARQLAELAMRLKQLRANSNSEKGHENLKSRIRESQLRSWAVCHGRCLVEGGARAKAQAAPRAVEDVIQRALMYVEEHEGGLVQELFLTEAQLRHYIAGLKRAMRKRKQRMTLSESRQRLANEHILFGDKNIKPEAKAPVDGGLLHLPNKPRKKPLKVKASSVASHLSALASGGAGGERRLPLVDRLNKAQADMTAALMALASPPPDKKRRNSVSFRKGQSNQSSTASMDPLSPRPPGGLESTAEEGRRNSRQMSHRKLVQASPSPSPSRRTSSASAASGDRGQGEQGEPSAGGAAADSHTQEPLRALSIDRDSLSIGSDEQLGSADSLGAAEGLSFVETTVETTESDDLVARRGRGRTVSVESQLSQDSMPSPHVPSSAPDAGGGGRAFRGRHRTASASSSSSNKNSGGAQPKPVPPSRPPPPRRPKSEQMRARKLAMPARYESAEAADASGQPRQLTSNDLKVANKIAENQMILVRKQHADRSRQIAELTKRASAAAARADQSGDHFVSSWEAQATSMQKSSRVFHFGLACKETDWAEDIKTKYDCFVTDGTDSAYGRLGVNFQVDMTSMRHRLKDKRFEMKCENLLRHKWFVVLVVKLKEKIETVFTPIPMSCFKFLLAVKEVFVLGLDLTTPVFFTLVEATIAAEDHKDVVVHRTLKSVRDELKIHPDTFLEYLERREIQPSPELLSQVRAYRKKMVNQSKLAGLAKTINSGKASMLASRPRRWGNTLSEANSRPETEASTPGQSSPEHSRSQTPAPGTAPSEGRQLDVVSSAVVSKLEKQVTFSVEEPVLFRAQTMDEKKQIFDNIADVANELWRQKHALLMRHDIASTDDRNSNIFATPDNSFELFGDGTMSSLGGIGEESNGFISMDNLEEGDEEEEEGFD